MRLNFSEDIVMCVDMIQYINKVFQDFPKELTSTSSTPATHHLFKIQDKEDAKHLSKDQPQDFHHTLAQLLFLVYRARHDIQRSVAFLTTRVQWWEYDNWGKVK